MSDGDVGRGKPPTRNQFQKGKSGNPDGRPKGSKNISTVLNSELDQKVSVRENGKIKKITKREAAMKAHVAKTMQGDARHTALLYKETREAESFSNAATMLVISDERRSQILNRYKERLREQILAGINKANTSGDNEV